jgi:hypothetical protein
MYSYQTLSKLPLEMIATKTLTTSSSMKFIPIRRSVIMGTEQAAKTSEDIKTKSNSQEQASPELSKLPLNMQNLTSQNILHLQRVIGNRAVQRLLKTPSASVIQRDPPASAQSPANRPPAPAGRPPVQPAAPTGASGVRPRTIQITMAYTGTEPTSIQIQPAGGAAAQPAGQPAAPANQPATPGQQPHIPLINDYNGF